VCALLLELLLGALAGCLSLRLRRRLDALLFVLRRR
jgi:uncharacterized OsmC-like protein